MFRFVSLLRLQLYFIFIHYSTQIFGDTFVFQTIYEVIVGSIHTKKCYKSNISHDHHFFFNLSKLIKAIF